MSTRHLLHRAMHRIPGVPAHTDRPSEHQGTPAGHQGTADGHRSPSLHHRRNHSPARPPRIMAAWQRRIAALFGREL